MWSLLPSEGLLADNLFSIYFAPVAVLIARHAPKHPPGHYWLVLRLAVESGMLTLSYLRSCSSRIEQLQGRSAASRHILSYSVCFHLRKFASIPPETDHLLRNSALISLVKTIKPSFTTKSLPRFSVFLHPKMLRLRNRRPTTSKSEMRICSNIHSLICQVARRDGDRQCTFQITRPTSVK